MVVKGTIDGPKQEIVLVTDSNWKPSPNQLLRINQPPVLSYHLFEKIRKFCPPQCQDLVCPYLTQEYERPPTPKDLGPSWVMTIIWTTLKKVNPTEMELQSPNFRYCSFTTLQKWQNELC